MMLVNERFVVITGGPGAGKSTLIEELRRRGCFTAGEAGRAIIKDQKLMGGRALPSVDPNLFAEVILAWDIRSYMESQEAPDRRVFFDRGVPDAAISFQQRGIPIPDHFSRAVTRYRYANAVFIAPPWPEIYTRDEERKQSFDEAQRTYEALRSGYLAFGYELVELPLTSVKERADFVLNGSAAAARLA